MFTKSQSEADELNYFTLNNLPINDLGRRYNDWALVTLIGLSNSHI